MAVESNDIRDRLAWPKRYLPDDVGTLPVKVRHFHDSSDDAGHFKSSPERYPVAPIRRGQHHQSAAAGAGVARS